MKRNLLLIAAIFAFAAAASAQGTASAATVPNFGGSWTLDVSKSKLGNRNNIEAQVVTVTQTETTLKVVPATQRASLPAPSGVPLGELVRGSGAMGGDVPATYTLGKESKTTQEGPMGSVPVTLNAKIEGGKLHLTRSVTINGQMGEMTMTTKETWELSSDGSTLTINTERNTPRGNESTTRVFTKKT